MAKKSNLAYDLSRYEYAQKQTKLQKSPQIKQIKNTKPYYSVPKFVIACLACGMLLFAVLYGQVETNSLYKQIATENKQIELLNSDRARIQSEIETKTALKNVEDYAINVLGMHKLNKNQIEYVKIKSENSFEINNNATANVFVKLKNTFNDFMEYITG